MRKPSSSPGEAGVSAGTTPGGEALDGDVQHKPERESATGKWLKKEIAKENTSPPPSEEGQ